MRSTPEEQMKRADVVFTGLVVDKKSTPDDPERQGGLSPIVWTFAVEDSKKGEASKRLLIESASNSAACGINFQMGGRYQVFANQNGTKLKAFLCSGTQLLTGEEKEQSQEAAPETDPTCADDKSSPQ